MARPALDFTAGDIIAAFEQDGPEATAKALQNWRGAVADESLAEYKDDPETWLKGMENFDKNIFTPAYQPALQGSMELGPPSSDLAYSPTTRANLPLPGPSGGTVGNYNLVFGGSKDYAVVQRNDAAYDESPSKPIIIPIEKATRKNIEAEKSWLETSIAGYDARISTIFDSMGDAEKERAANGNNELVAPEFDPLEIEFKKAAEEQSLARLKLAELNGPNAAYAFAATKVADAIAKEHSDHFRRWEPTEDFWRSFRVGLKNFRATANRIIGDETKATELDIEASNLAEQFPGTIQYETNAASITGTLSGVIGQQLPNLALMATGIGAPEGGARAAASLAATLASGGLQEYGANRMDSTLRAMQMRNDARKASELGLTEEAKQFESRAQEIESNANLRALEAGANATAWEMVFPEHIARSFAGKSAGRAVITSAGQNAIEEFGTALTQNFGIDPGFGYETGGLSGLKEAASEGFYGGLYGGLQGGVMTVGQKWFSKPTAPPVAAAVPAAEPLTTLAGIANDQGNTPVDPSPPPPAPESKVLISNNDGRFVSTPEGWRQLHDPANLPEGAREDGTTDVAPEMAARLNQNAAQKQNAPSLADLNARVRQVYGPNAWVARYGEMYSVPLGLNGKGGNAVQDGGVPLDELLKIIGWNQNVNQNVNPELNSESTSGNPTTAKTPVPAWQEGSYAQVEGYDGQLRRNGERWELHTADNKIIEINEDTVVTPRPETVADFRAKVESGEASPTVQEASFTPHPDGTLALQDSNGQTWYPQNARLSRTITGQGTQLNVRLRTKEGRIVNLRGDQAIQAQDALLARATAMEAAGQPVRLSIGDALPENPLTPEAVTTHAAAMGIEPGNKVSVVNDPQENWEGRKNADGTIELNAARLATPEDVTRVMQHEAAHLAEEDADMAPTVDALMSAIPSEVRADMQQAIRDLGYEETAIPSEEVANFAQQLNHSFGQLPAWTRLLTRLKTWAKQKLGMNLTYRDAQALAARIITRGLQMAQSDLRSNSPSKLSRPAHAQPLDEPVLTPSGYVPMGSLQIGDVVVTPYGSSRIMQIHEFGQRPLYRVTVDGKSTRATADHRWQARQLGTDGEGGILDSAFLLALHRSGAGVEIPIVDLNLN